MLHSNRLYWPSAAAAASISECVEYVEPMTGDWPFKSVFIHSTWRRKKLNFRVSSSSSSTKNTRVRGECTFQLKRMFFFSFFHSSFPDWNRTIVELEFTSLKWNKFFRRRRRSDCSHKWSFQIVIELNVLSKKQWNWYARARSSTEGNQLDRTNKIYRKCIVECWLRVRRTMDSFASSRRGKQNKRKVAVDSRVCSLKVHFGHE